MGGVFGGEVSITQRRRGAEIFLFFDFGGFGAETLPQVENLREGDCSIAFSVKAAAGIKSLHLEETILQIEHSTQKALYGEAV
ncbi:MAG: hypothetical protein D6803_02110 [Anaerolineae bacterium]|nr:MAG: hypothetical protein D6803_02110 [Anaerolineae bacterium]